MKGLNGRKRKRNKTTWDNNNNNNNNNPTLSATNQIQEHCHEENNQLEEGVPAVSLNPIVKPPKKVFFILDNAPIKKIQIKKGVWKVAQSKDHDAAIKKLCDPKISLEAFNKFMEDFRSDFVHEALKGIFDSRLCKLGMVGGVYVKIANGVLFKIQPHVRIMRTLQRFCGVMLELLNKSSVSAKETNEKLLQVIEEPVTRHLPPNSQIIGISSDSKKVVDMEKYVSAADDDRNLVFVIGASQHGKISGQYGDNFISVTNYPLAPRGRIDIICKALENEWNLF